MQTTEALERYVQIIANGSRSERVDFTKLDGGVGNFFTHQADPVFSMLPQVDATKTKTHSAVVALGRIFWSLVPAKLLTSNVTPNYEALVDDALVKYPGLRGKRDFRDSLSMVFKRLYIARVEGRGRAGVATLDLERKDHKELLEQQRNRCNLCAFEFDLDRYWFGDDDEEGGSSQEMTVPEEIVPDRLHRSPQLDHIIPWMIGGDRRENWQVLCRSCNSGKASYVSYLSVFSEKGNQVFAEMNKLTIAKRYGVLANVPGEEYQDALSKCVPGDKKAFRIFLKDPQFLLDSTNLVAKFL